MKDPKRLAPLFLGDRNDLETRWLEYAPSGQQAFDTYTELLTMWSARVDDAPEPRDIRPWFTRRYWSRQDSVLT
jgi:hypothetical protein